jgi:hypothetical protein
MARVDKDFLLGEASWFGPGGLPFRLPYEVEAPQAWNGWRRQRLKPGLTGFLYPSAWSIFFLAAGLIPMFLNAIGNGIGMDLRLAVGLFLGAFFLLWLAAVGHSFNQVEGSPAKMLMWNLVRIETVLLTVLVWIMLNQPVGNLAVLAVLISIPLWLSHLVRISTLLGWPQGRWLLPIAHVNIGLSTIDEKWVSESKRWARRPLARRKIESGEVGETQMELVLFGLREDNQDFIAVHLVHPSGVILDPFVGPEIQQNMLFSRLGPIFADIPSVVAVREQIGTPPVSPVVAEWPSNLVTIFDQEE